MTIILRKIRNVLTPMVRTSTGPTFGMGMPPSRALSVLFSPLILGILVLAFIIAWFLADPGALAALPAIGVFPFVGETAIAERREAFLAKQKTALEVIDLIGKDRDFSRKPVLEKLGATDEADAISKFRQLNSECGQLGKELQQEELKTIEREIRNREDEIKNPSDGSRPSVFNDAGRTKSVGQLYIESAQFKASQKNPKAGPEWEAEGVGMKTLFETAAGFAIENVRSGVLVEKATRPIQVTDLIPTFPIGQSAFVYMEETTRTHAAAERAEGTAYPESTFVWTQKSSPVQKIADSIPVTDEQLEDEQQVKSLLEQRLSFGVRQRLDSQIVVGNGTAPNLRGILNVVGIQTMAKGADNGIVAFAKALALVRFTGRAIPSGAIAHPNDWLDILLTQDANGNFLFGNPFQGPGPTSVFGVTVAQSDGLTENTVVVGDFANFSRLDERRGVRVQTGYVGTQFTEGEVTIRADLRAAFTLTRPAAFVTITGM